MMSEEGLPQSVRAYLFTSRLLASIQNRVKAAHHGLFLGLLDPSDLQALTDYHYGSNQRKDSGTINCQELTFNLSGLEKWEQRVIEKHFGDCKSILLGSAGGGREALALSRMGFSVEAFECNPRLVLLCQNLFQLQGVKVNVTQAEPGRVPVSLETYDGAILGWYAYGHIFGRRRRIELLREFRQHLVKGAPLLLSFPTRPDTESVRLSHRLTKLLRAARRAEPIELGDSIGPFFYRAFIEKDIREELAEAGFGLVFYSVHPVDSFGHALGRA